MKNRWSPLVLVLSLLSLPTFVGGCFGDVVIEDDLDFELFTAKLHTPYVVGSDVRLHVSRHRSATVAGWRVDADDPGVFQVLPGVTGDDENLYVMAHAVGAGQTRLRIYDESGHGIARRDIVVEQPDRIELVPAGLIKVRGDDAPAVDPARPVRVLVGGTATFEVRYFRGTERLFGNGALTPTVDASSLEAEPRQSYLFENREWISLSPSAVGSVTLSLSVGGQVVATFDVRGVDDAEVAGVEIEAESARDARKDDLLYLLAHARDGAGEDVWGVEMRWAVDGLDEPGDGDLYYYHYAEDESHTVSAERDGLADEVTVQMSGGGVTSSNQIGCQAAGSGRGLGLLLLLALGWVWRRRIVGLAQE